MTIQQAIEKAIDGGYKNQIIDNWLTDAESGDVLENQDNDLVANLFLDPLFWQSLGKAVGEDVSGGVMSVEKSSSQGFDADGRLFYHGTWGSYQMHRLVDHIAEGKGAVSFFEKL